MNSSPAALRRIISHRPRILLNTSRQWTRHASSQPTPQRSGGRIFSFAAIFVVVAGGTYYYPSLKQIITQQQPEKNEVPTQAELRFEKTRQQAISKEDNRDLISSQHLQVKNSWENPGVYVWGSNAGKVIDPSSDEKVVKLPKRLQHFDGQLLRDLKLSQGFGAAILENGDLVQWGSGYSKADPRPVTTVKGKDLVKIGVSADRIIALSRKGQTLSIPSTKDDLEGGLKSSDAQSSGWSLWNSSGTSSLSYRDITPSGLGRGEKVTDVASGLEHCLMLTSKGRVFSAAASTTEFPSKGQLGIPGLTWDTRPRGPFDQPHEVEHLKGFQIKEIAAGDFHSVVLDGTGRVFSFGDNQFGQLGLEGNVGFSSIDTPTLVSTNKLYAGTGLIPKVTDIAAGGLTTFFTVDAEAPVTNIELRSVAPARRMPRTTSDVWAAGQGVYGSLGTGRWTHATANPMKVKNLSGLFEFDESANKMIPIKLKSLSVGATHCSAVMDNVTETNISGRSTENETNWGADVVFWGGNEHWQLGTGKRNNLNTPGYIGPLDGGDGDAVKGRSGEVHRLCITPRQTVRIGEGGRGRKATLEQKVECGRYVTGVYSAV